MLCRCWNTIDTSRVSSPEICGVDMLQNGIAGQRQCKQNEHGELEEVYYADVCLCAHVTLAGRDGE